MAVTVSRLGDSRRSATPWALEPVLPTGQPRVLGADVLEEAQRPTGAQHPTGYKSFDTAIDGHLARR